MASRKPRPMSKSRRLLLALFIVSLLDDLALALLILWRVMR